MILARHGAGPSFKVTLLDIWAVLLSTRGESQLFFIAFQLCLG